MSQLSAEDARLEDDRQRASAHIADDLLVALKPARALSRLIGFGAVATGAIMIFFSRSVEATTSSTLVDAVVHLSNVKFMAAMWCVTGVIFILAASSLHEKAAWRLLRLMCVGVSGAALLRLVEMERLDSYEPYGMAAASVELIVPGVLIYLTERAYTRADR